MHVAVMISSNDSESVWNAFRFANTALASGDRVEVFLLGKGVEAPAIGTLQYDIQEQMDAFLGAGGRLIGCSVCCESRKELMPSLQSALRCEMGSMQALHDLVACADKVLSF